MRESCFVRSGLSAVAIALFGAVIPGANPVAAAEPIAGSARVLDGDTIEIGGVRIRLEGIDAPEAGQTCKRPGGVREDWSCGTAATNALGKMLKNETVICDARGRDKYGRTLGVCAVNGRDVNAEMVRTGHAWAFVKYSRSYVAEEAVAKAARAGVWQGESEPAWAYRERQWKVASADAPEGCAIKGNVSRKGNLYHTPWSHWYGRVKIDVSKGERWFCSEEEAIAAGWRPAATN